MHTCGGCGGCMFGCGRSWVSHFLRVGVTMAPQGDCETGYGVKEWVVKPAGMVRYAGYFSMGRRHGTGVRATS